MKEFLYGWVQDIAFYTLLMEVVLHVLPDRNQKQYLRFFMGIVLIILVISPVLSAAGLDRTLDETYARQTYDQELQEFLRRQEEIEARYEERLEENLADAKKELLEETEDGTETQEGKGLEESTEHEPKNKTENAENGGEELGIPEIKVEIGSDEES